MAYSLITNSKNIHQVLTTSFEKAGQSIVSSLITKGRKAIFDFIAAEVLQKGATVGLGVVEKAATTVAINKAAATTAGVAATASYPVAASAAVTAMIAETAAIKVLTEAYVNLAAAEAAASLGVTTGNSIAAAAKTKIALETLLGFDDPRNDAIAYRHGQDYARMFMTGAQSEWGAPGFANTVNSNFPVAIAQGNSSGGQAIIINVAGSMITESDLIKNVVIPATEREIDFNNSLITKREALRTGGRV
jgi:hypothetical protein